MGDELRNLIDLVIVVLAAALDTGNFSASDWEDSGNSGSMSIGLEGSDAPTSL